MRTQIALEAEQHPQVKQKAASLEITMAEYIRRLVDQDLAVCRRNNRACPARHRRPDQLSGGPLGVGGAQCGGGGGVQG